MEKLDGGTRWLFKQNLNALLRLSEHNGPLIYADQRTPRLSLLVPLHIASLHVAPRYLASSSLSQPQIIIPGIFGTWSTHMCPSCASFISSGQKY